MAKSSWGPRVQVATQLTAVRHGDGWTSADLELVAACGDIPAAELATALGRTLYSITSVRQALASGLPVGSDRVVAPVRAERAYTYIDGDCPDW